MNLITAKKLPVWGPGDAPLQLDDSRLEGAASTPLTWFSTDRAVTFLTTPRTRNDLRFMQPQKHSGEWLAPWLKRQVFADWQMTDARKHNYRGWVLITLHPPCLSPPALHPSSQRFWITIASGSNCAQWLQTNCWHGGCRQNVTTVASTLLKEVINATWTFQIAVENIPKIDYADFPHIILSRRIALIIFTWVMIVLHIFQRNIHTASFKDNTWLL